MDKYYSKYIKYKKKYFNLKKQLKGGAKIQSLKRLRLAEMKRWNKQLRIDIGDEPIPEKTWDWLDKRENEIEAMKEGSEKSEAYKEFNADLADKEENATRGYNVHRNPKRAMTDEEKVQYDSNKEALKFFGKQDAVEILKERMKPNEEFERILKNVGRAQDEFNSAINSKLDDGTQRQGTKYEFFRVKEDDKIMIEQYSDDIKAAFDLKKSITDLTDGEYLAKIFKEKIIAKLELPDNKYEQKLHTDTNIVVKLLVFPSGFFERAKYRSRRKGSSGRKRRRRRRRESAEEGESTKEILLRDLIKLRDEGKDPVKPLGPTSIGFETLTAWLAWKKISVEEQIKIVEKQIEHDKNVEFYTIRRQKGLYIYDEFRTEADDVRGLDKLRWREEKKYDNYESIYDIYSNYRGNKDWIFTIVDNREDSGEVTITRGDIDASANNSLHLVIPEGTT